uniref:Uncharacterized protein n=1 Tax=Rhizophora mucronata TaxID=61149 RepID=A0A2P2JX31_RHIMU
MNTRSTETQQKTGLPQIVRIDKALKLAEHWVNNMSKSIEDEAAQMEAVGRPERLGLGAKVVRQSKVGPLNDPVERKLHAKLESQKRKAAKKNEESISLARDGNDDSDDNSDNELESRTSAFAKKRGPPTPFLQVKKKKK